MSRNGMMPGVKIKINIQISYTQYPMNIRMCMVFSTIRNMSPLLLHSMWTRLCCIHVQVYIHEAHEPFNNWLHVYLHELICCNCSCVQCMCVSWWICNWSAAGRHILVILCSLSYIWCLAALSSKWINYEVSYMYDHPHTHEAAAHYLLCWMVQVEEGILCLWCLIICSKKILHYM